MGRQGPEDQAILRVRRVQGGLEGAVVVAGGPEAARAVDPGRARNILPHRRGHRTPDTQGGRG